MSDKELKLTDSDGDGTFGEGDDLSTEQKTTLGDYLSNLTRTHDKANHFTVSAARMSGRIAARTVHRHR